MINIFDKILILALILFAISFNFIITSTFTKEEVNNITIKIDKKVYATYNLNINETYIIENGVNFNTIEVKDGYVNMIDANCNDKLCVYQRKINSNFETIVCLPHKLIIEVDNNIESEIDSIAR